MTRISSPTARPCRPAAAHGCTSSQASGAPSDPCRGASPRAVRTERITPSGRSRPPANPARIALPLIWTPEDGVSLVEHLQVELAEARGIGKEVDGDDLPARSR